MSRTYRKRPIWICENCRKPVSNRKTIRFRSNICKCKTRNHFEFGFKKRMMKTQDYKAWNKPPKTFKKLRQREFRAKCKDAFIKGKEFPINKKSDEMYWT